MDWGKEASRADIGRASGTCANCCSWKDHIEGRLGLGPYPGSYTYMRCNATAEAKFAAPP